VTIQQSFDNVKPDFADFLEIFSIDHIFKMNQQFLHCFVKLEAFCNNTRLYL